MDHEFEYDRGIEEQRNPKRRKKSKKTLRDMRDAINEAMHGDSDKDWDDILEEGDINEL